MNPTYDEDDDSVSNSDDGYDSLDDTEYDISKSSLIQDGSGALPTGSAMGYAQNANIFIVGGGS